MDPVSSQLGIAASVAQFVDFTGSLISKTHEIRKSSTGKTGRNNDLESITESLNGLINSFFQPEDNQNASSDDAAIVKLCDDCKAVAEQLLLALGRLGKQDNHRVWRSFRQALKTVWSQEQIDGLQKRLDIFRQQISMHILVSLR
jgi:hypothetical protein